MNNIFIFSSVGSELNVFHKKNIFNSWNIKDFDSGCVVYNNDNFEYSQYFKTVLYNKNFKFPNFHYYLLHENDVLDKYEYIAILDDDLLFEEENPILNIVNIMVTYGLTICSPCNRCKLKRSGHSIMNCKESKNQLLITNFAEMGAMVIESQFLKGLNSREIIVEDFGYDYYICNIALQNNKKIGIINNIGYNNPEKEKRPNGWHTYQKYKNNNLLEKINPSIIETIVL